MTLYSNIDAPGSPLLPEGGKEPSQSTTWLCREGHIIMVLLKQALSNRTYSMQMSSKGSGGMLYQILLGQFSTTLRQLSPECLQYSLFNHSNTLLKLVLYYRCIATTNRQLHWSEGILSCTSHYQQKTIHKYANTGCHKTFRDKI